MPNYRLVCHVYGNRPLTLSPVYRDDLTGACLVGENLFVALEPYPHKRPYRIDVIDVWTRETVTRLTPMTPRDPAVCAACGAPRDPFESEAPKP